MTVFAGPLQVLGSILLVWQESPNPTAPYTNWDTAAHQIQEAVDAAEPGDTVLVTNGIYSTGGRPWQNTLTNRVTIARGIIVRSLNGPEVTIIQGTAGFTGNNGEGAVRCAYVGTNAVLSGFTLTNGHTLTDSTGGGHSGGGVWCENKGIVTNCVLIGNYAIYGAGATGGNLHQCTIAQNTASRGGGGSAWVMLYQCCLSNNTATYEGGGVYGSVISNCTLTLNSAGYAGGGAIYGSIYNCTIRSNNGASYGGGCYESTIYNSILIGNSAYEGGGVYSIWLDVYNSIFFGNSAWNGFASRGANLYNCTVVSNFCPDYYYPGKAVEGLDFPADMYNSIVYYNGRRQNIGYMGRYNCCSISSYGPANQGLITNEPRFVNLSAGDFRLRHDSPCIDTGRDLSAMFTNDFLGNLRPLDGNGDGIAAFDIGAYEFDLRTVVSNEWFLQYGLNRDDPHILSHNPDNDPYTTFQEWLTNTDPTNASSFFRIEAISNSPPVSVYFMSATNRFYTLYYCTNLTPQITNTVWTNVPGQINIPGIGGSQSLICTNELSPRFYKLGVKL